METNKFDNLIEETKNLLNNYPAAELTKKYLDTRLTAEVQNIFNFGYFPDQNNLKVLYSSFSQSILEELHLSYSKDHYDAMGSRKVAVSFFENYPLIMPFKNVYGENIALIGRTICSEEQRTKTKIAKYKNTIFTKGNHLFGLYENKYEIVKQDCVYLVEGQFDVIKAYEKGMKNVVALGSSNLSQNQFALICRYTNNIFLLLDNDDAGKLGRERILKKYSQFANIRNFYIPKEFKDIDSFFQKNELSDLQLTTYF